MALQIKRNSEIAASEDAAIENLKTYVSNNDVADGEPILARYQEGSGDDITYKTVLGVVTIVDSKKYLSIFQTDAIYVGDF